MFPAAAAPVDAYGCRLVWEMQRGGMPGASEAGDRLLHAAALVSVPRPLRGLALIGRWLEAPARGAAQTAGQSKWAVG